MSRCQQVGRPMLRSLQQGVSARPCSAALFSTTTSRREDVVADTPASASEPPPPPPPSSKAVDEDWRQRRLDPNTTTLRWAEKKLIKAGTPPIGSRRRRVAIRTSADIPFEQLPYQAFQEARKILQDDRQEKLDKIMAATARLRFIEQTDPKTLQGGEAMKARRIDSARKYLDELKIQADINDPLVKRRFEDGLGDMSKPIYRHLADRRWRAMERKIILQRINQFFIVPDLLPKFEPTADVKLFFRGEKVAPGEILDSRITEVPPSLRVQVFDKGERLLSVAVVDADVPNTENDSFDRRCHFLATNIPWDPTKSSLPLSRVAAAGGDVPVPWLPPFSQKGAPYHRLAIFVFEHKDRVDPEHLKELYGARDGFALQSFRNATRAAPVGFNMFRSVWDEGTAAVMERHGIPGAEVEFKREKYESLKPHRKARGWEAKRQGPKYKFLEKYVKRLA
ncbi:phosphatidylethanolamine-binding protein [Coniochaeta sp. PMI_546]|nr:phosphatidylethanolamine-binding protein [Coniochaeta sp. PMI_546]